MFSIINKFLMICCSVRIIKYSCLFFFCFLKRVQRTRVDYWKSTISALLQNKWWFNSMNITIIIIEILILLVHVKYMDMWAVNLTFFVFYNYISLTDCPHFGKFPLSVRHSKKIPCKLCTGHFRKIDINVKYIHCLMGYARILAIIRPKSWYNHLVEIWPIANTW